MYINCEECSQKEYKMMIERVVNSQEDRLQIGNYAVASK